METYHQRLWYSISKWKEKGGAEENIVLEKSILSAHENTFLVRLPVEPFLGKGFNYSLTSCLLLQFGWTVTDQKQSSSGVLWKRCSLDYFCVYERLKIAWLINEAKFTFTFKILVFVVFSLTGVLQLKLFWPNFGKILKILGCVKNATFF